MKNKKNLLVLFSLTLIFVVGLLAYEKKLNQPYSKSKDLNEGEKTKQAIPNSPNREQPAANGEISKVDAPGNEKQEGFISTELRMDWSIQFLSICVAVSALLIPIISFLFRWREKQDDKRINEKIQEINEWKLGIEEKFVKQISSFLWKKIESSFSSQEERQLCAQYVRTSFHGIIANEQLKHLQKQDMSGFVSDLLDLGKVELALAQVLSQDVKDIWNGLAVFLDLSMSYSVPPTLIELISILEKQKRFQAGYLQIKELAERLKHIHEEKTI